MIVASLAHLARSLSVSACIVSPPKPASAIALDSVVSVSAQRPAFKVKYSISRSGRVWSFVGPNKKRFWSFGVDCVDTGVAPKDYKPSNPAFSAVRIYGSESEWARRTNQNLRKWGFNSLGAWSDAPQLNRHAGRHQLPYFYVLHMGAWGRAPWNDMFAPEMEKNLDLGARSQIPNLRYDPNLVGYFSDNELGWWPDTLFAYYLDFPLNSPGRQALVQSIRKTYHDDFDAFQRDWKIVGPTAASGWEVLSQPVKLRLRAGTKGIQAVNDWTYALASRYYTLVRQIIHRYDDRHPILGDRYCQFYSIPVVRASRGKIELASTNYGAEWPNGSTSRFFLATLSQVSGRPALVTEFYECAKQNRSGNRNTGAIFPTVRTQAQRAEAFSTYVKELALKPYVIGAHWFQYNDEPPHGRADGEDYNMGLVDVRGKPYDELVLAAARLHPTRLHERAVMPPVRHRVSVPDAPKNAMSGLADWPKAKGFIDPRTDLVGQEPFGDLYVCQDRKNLYLGLIAMDFMDESLYEGDVVPAEDRPCLRLSFDGASQDLVIRFGGKGLKPLASRTWLKITDIPGLKHSLMVKIPRYILPKTLRLRAVLTSHSRAQEMRWPETLLVLASKTR